MNQLLRHHSHLGYQRMVSQAYANQEISCHSDRFTNPHVLSLRLPSESARFCLDCVNEDLDFHGASYWRRTHQLPGIDACAKHGSVLLELSSSAMRVVSPSVMGGATPALHSSELALYLSNPFIQRFMALSDMALQASVPLAPAVMAKVLSQQKRMYDKTRRSIPLSESVRELAPSFWIAKHFPALFARESGSRAASIDDVLRSRHVAHATKSYLLAMAVLWENPDEGMQACLEEAKRSGNGLNEKGGERAIWSMLEGQSIQTACKEQGVHLKDFEYALRRMLLGTAAVKSSLQN